MATADFHARELTEHVVIRVRGLKAFGMRARIAGALFHLGGWIAGTKIEMEMADARDIRRLDLGYRDILVVRCSGVLSQDRAEALRDHLRQVLDNAGRFDVKVLITDRSSSLEVLAAPPAAGHQPATGAHAPGDPPNQGSAGRR